MKNYNQLVEFSAVAYFRIHGFEVYTFEDIIRLFVREALYANKKSL